MPGESDANSGMGRSWQSTLSAATRYDAERRLQNLGYTWQWLDDGCLRVTIGTPDEDDRFLARQHARIERAADDSVKVLPIDALNGVFRKADAPVDLHDGMTVLVGREVLPLVAVEFLQPWGDGVEHPPASGRGAHEHAAPVERIGEALGEAGPGQPVDQAGDVGGPVEEAVGDGPDGDSAVGVVGEAQRPQRDVRPTDFHAAQLNHIRRHAQCQQHGRV